MQGKLTFIRGDIRDGELVQLVVKDVDQVYHLAAAVGVQLIAKDPVWTMPDWAFIEEGEDLPRNWSDRIDKASLGDYALYLGDGYMIHGTLYQRYLGRNVTHGCIRLGDADLEFTYRNVPVGTLVFMY